MAGNFRGKSEKALKINFRGFKFCYSNQSRGMALLQCNRYTRSRSSLLLYRDLDK